MQPEETAARPDRRRLKLAALLGAAVLAIPGAGIVSNAFAADGGGSGSSSTQQQAPAGGDAFPVQTQDENAPDGRDCPEENGGGSGSGGGSGESGTSADTAL